MCRRAVFWCGSIHGEGKAGSINQRQWVDPALLPRRELFFLIHSLPLLCVACRSQCSARTLWGRVRPLPGQFARCTQRCQLMLSLQLTFACLSRFGPVDIQHGNSDKRAYAQRQSVNTPIQGTAADMAKRAMIAIHQQIQQLHQKYEQTFPTLARLTLQWHDEIILEVRRGLEAEVAAIVRHCMENVFVPPKGEAQARVPFPVSMKVGPTLGTLQPFELPREERPQQQEQNAVAATSDEVRELLELAAVDEDEWGEYAAATPASQQLRPSLASTVTTALSPSRLSTPSTPATAASYSLHQYTPTPPSQCLTSHPPTYAYSSSRHISATKHQPRFG